MLPCSPKASNLLDNRHSHVFLPMHCNYPLMLKYSRLRWRWGWLLSDVAVAVAVAADRVRSCTCVLWLWLFVVAGDVALAEVVVRCPFK